MVTFCAASNCRWIIKYSAIEVALGLHQCRVGVSLHLKFVAIGCLQGVDEVAKTCFEIGSATLVTPVSPAPLITHVGFFFVIVAPVPVVELVLEF